ncbi:MAG TPA: hypothetical protein VKB75_08340 [Jatrophihabitans sp.]|nr:hypothetical protein [Jatrophihabitans sp.]
MATERHNPAAAAAQWFEKRLHRTVTAHQVSQIDPVKLCGVPLPGGDALCMREADHPGRHEALVYADAQSRLWRLDS